MKRPFIGISATYLMEKQQILLRDTYTNAVLEAGGLPVLLPTILVECAVDAFLDRIDGLLLSGGGDVDPACYGEERVPECGEANAQRDAFELMITKKAIERRMPVFGICRGIQVLNVVYGGTLVQDIPSTYGCLLEKHRQPEPYNDFWHEIALKENGYFQQIVGEKTFMTNSMHHQAIKLLGGTLEAEAWSSDGIIEAVVDRENEAVFGVQFHPEYLTEKSLCARKLFARFVLNAKVYAADKK